MRFREIIHSGDRQRHPRAFEIALRCTVLLSGRIPQHPVHLPVSRPPLKRRTPSTILPIVLFLCLPATAQQRLAQPAAQTHLSITLRQQHGREWTRISSAAPGSTVQVFGTLRVGTSARNTEVKLAVPANTTYFGALDTPAGTKVRLCDTRCPAIRNRLLRSEVKAVQIILPHTQAGQVYHMSFLVTAARVTANTPLRPKPPLPQEPT